MLSSLQLQALVAVSDAGSFEAAAKSLHVSASALSQRVSALEKTIGSTLLMRQRPIRPTLEGEKILALARATVLLHAETLAELKADLRQRSDSSALSRIHLAINSDSLATWFKPIIELVAAEQKWLLELRIDDESQTAESLAKGQVTCAISASAKTNAAAKVEPLGVMKYRAVGAPNLFRIWGSKKADELPFIRFNEEDFLQHRFLEAIGAKNIPAFHSIPANHDFNEAVIAGLGWAMLPSQVAKQLVASKDVEYLAQDAPEISLKLYWHRQRMHSVTLDEFSQLVKKVAAEELAT